MKTHFAVPFIGGAVDEPSIGQFEDTFGYLNNVEVLILYSISLDPLSYFILAIFFRIYLFSFYL